MKPENLGVELYIISDIYLMFLSRDIVPLGECKRGFFRLGKTYCTVYMQFIALRRAHTRLKIA